MRKTLALLTLLVTIAAPALAQSAHNYEFANGNWFDGQKFVRTTFYSVAGRLSSNSY